MSEPSEHLVDAMKRISGDIVILGIGGKMGYTLGRQAKRAADAAGIDKRIIGVSRFSDASIKDKIESCGIETIQCDLLDIDAVKDLPDSENVIFMAGRKFGTTGSEDMTWAMNVLLPGNVVYRYRDSRIVAFSTGCVYPFVKISSGGSREEDPVDPVGEYSVSCLGRERVFQYASGTYGTKITLIRLNYAIDMRYGVLFDIASKVYEAGVVDVSVPAFNAIWQGDATDHILRSVEYCDNPPFVLNVTGPETMSTLSTAEAFAKLFDRPVEPVGESNGTALLNNATKSHELFGYPRIPMGTMIRWTADWIRRGGPSLGKPTHFDSNDGQF